MPVPSETRPEKWTAYAISIAVLMVLTGSINTLAAKWADELSTTDESGNKIPFDHPFLQALCMFIGEFFCLIAYGVLLFVQRVRRTREVNEEFGDSFVSEQPPLRFNPFIFFPAALCDMCATSLMYMGLTLTNAASFQMLRGSVIIFTGLLSVAFLRSVLYVYKWISMFVIVLGLVIVGLADVIREDNSDFNGVISGDLLIIMAQCIVAVQMVYEQAYVNKYNVNALVAVGLEGLFGLLSLSVLCVLFYFIKVPPTFSKVPSHRLEDVLYAFYQMGQNYYIVLALLGTIVSIAFFNFAGISITKLLSATSRMVLDSVRVIFIWAFSVSVKWQRFSFIHVIGFVILFSGMLMYNDILLGPSLWRKLGRRYPFVWKCCSWFYAVTENADSDNAILVSPDETEDNPA